jgi:hypothetical protein
MKRLGSRRLLSASIGLVLYSAQIDVSGPGHFLVHQEWYMRPSLFILSIALLLCGLSGTAMSQTATPSAEY